MVKKPTGEEGPIRVSHEGARWEKIAWPNSKEEIELLVAEGFARHVGHTDEPFFDVTVIKRIAEDDFDFTIETSKGTKYLELREVAPLDNFSQSYSGVPSNQTAGELADLIVAGIMEKSERYPKGEIGLVLLLYVTHWALRPGNACKQIIRVTLLRAPHKFERIYLCEALDREAFSVEKLYPAPIECLRFLDVERHRNAVTINVDPRQATFKRDTSGQIGVGLQLSKAEVRHLLGR